MDSAHGDAAPGHPAILEAKRTLTARVGARTRAAQQQERP